MIDRAAPNDGGKTRPAPARRGPEPRRLLVACMIVSPTAELALTCWFRSSSLGAIPTHRGDESYFGIQASRLARGDSFRMTSPTGNLLSPVLIACQAVLHLAFEPSAAPLRTPVALSGLAAVALVFLAASRRLDRPTGLLAATLLATVPVAIDFSRVGCEYGQTPLVGVLAACAALRGRCGWFLLTVLAGLLVHPTNVLLVPIFGPVLLVHLAGRYAGDPVGRRRALLGWSLLAGTGVVGLAVVLLRRPWIRTTLADRLDRLSEVDPARFLESLARFPFCGTIPGMGVEAHRDWVCGAALAVALPGVARLVRSGARDRLALVAGAIAGPQVLLILGGDEILDTAGRYGAVLLVPTALAVACLITALIPARPAPAGTPGVGPGHLAAAACLGAVLLYTAAVNPLGHTARVPETIWTFGPDVPDPYEHTLDLILRDVAEANRRAPAGPDGRRRLIIAQDYFVSTPLTYFLGDRDDVVVFELITIPELGMIVLGQDPLTAERPRLISRLAVGDYAVSGPCTIGGLGVFIGETARSVFPPDRVRAWPILPEENLTVYSIGDDDDRGAPGSDAALGRDDRRRDAGRVSPHRRSATRVRSPARPPRSGPRRRARPAGRRARRSAAGPAARSGPGSSRAGSRGS